MRLLLELLLAAVLVAVAWETPYRERLGEIVPMLARTKDVSARRAQRVQPTQVANAPAPQPQRISQPAASPAATISNGAWMWDPNRQGSLDRKKK